MAPISRPRTAQSGRPAAAKATGKGGKRFDGAQVRKGAAAKKFEKKSDKQQHSRDDKFSAEKSIGSVERKHSDAGKAFKGKAPSEKSDAKSLKKVSVEKSHDDRPTSRNDLKKRGDASKAAGDFKKRDNTKHSSAKKATSDKKARHAGGRNGPDGPRKSAPKPEPTAQEDKPFVKKDRAAAHVVAKKPKSKFPRADAEAQSLAENKHLLRPKTEDQEAANKQAAKRGAFLGMTEAPRTGEIDPEATTETTGLDLYEMESLRKDNDHLTGRWLNKQRTLLLGSRGMTTAHRYLLQDLKNLLPHHHTEQKWEKKNPLDGLVEVADLNGCQNVCYLETRKQRLFLWLAKSPDGPSARFEVQNLHTMDTLNFIGNALKYSRPLLIFDNYFKTVRQLEVLRELFVQALGTPRHHPLSKPFHDHALSFFYNDGRIWIRHYQIYHLPNEHNAPKTQLREIGPRLTLLPLRIFQKAFGGKTIWRQPPKDQRSPAYTGDADSETDRDASDGAQEDEEAVDTQAGDSDSDIL